MPSACLYITLLKLNSTPEQAKVNNSSSTFEFKWEDANPWSTNSLTQSYILSVMGKLVNKDLISNEHMFMLSWLILSWLTSLTNENESFVLWFEYINSSGFNICTHHLTSLCWGDLVIARMGLRGTFDLWTLGKPYNLGLYDPKGRMSS